MISKIINFLKEKPGLQLLIIILGYGVFMFASTQGEVIDYWSAEANCRTSGCARAYGFGFGVIFFGVPFCVTIFSFLVFLLLQSGFALIKYKAGFLESFFPTILPFVPTSILFWVFSLKIFEPGYETDQRFLAFMLLKMALLPLNLLLLIVCVRYICQIQWKKVIIAVMPVLVLAIALFGSYYKDTKPYFHYLDESDFYIEAKYWLFDKTVKQIHCRLDNEWCREEVMRILTKRKHRNRI